MKRFIATMLVVMMLITMMPTSVFAEGTVEPTSAPEVTTEPTSEITAESSAEATAEPTTDVAAESTIETTAKPNAESTTEATAAPTAKETLKPVVEPTVETNTSPTVDSTPQAETDSLAVATETAESEDVPGLDTIESTAFFSENTTEVAETAETIPDVELERAEVVFSICVANNSDSCYIGPCTVYYNGEYECTVELKKISGDAFDVYYEITEEGHVENSFSYRQYTLYADNVKASGEVHYQLSAVCNGKEDTMDLYITNTAESVDTSLEFNDIEGDSAFFVGETGKWRTMACGGQEPYEYYFEIAFTGFEFEPLAIQDYSASDTFEYTFEEAGEYSLVTNVRDAEGSVTESYGIDINVTANTEDTPFAYRQLTDTTCEITGYNGSETNISIPIEIDGLTVCAIADSAFSGQGSLTAISIPNTVTEIGCFAFENCTGLQSISIPSNVTELKDGVFDGCSGLTAVDIPYGVTFIAPGAFTGCVSLESIDIPDSVASIGYKAFYNCTGLASVSLPKGLSRIETCTFYGCANLRSIDIPSGISSIESSAFSKCSSLKSVVLPNGLTAISNSLFAYCTNLSSVNIPSGVTSIGDFAFSGCALTDVQLPAGINSIGSAAFQECAMTEIELPAGIRAISNDVFNNCTALKSIAIPNNVASIGDRAFNACFNLSTVDIPASVTTIGENAFYNCSSLQELRIYPSVENIGTDAFARTGDGFVVVVGENSFAHKYALDNNIAFRFDTEAQPSTTPTPSSTPTVEPTRDPELPPLTVNVDGNFQNVRTGTSTTYTASATGSTGACQFAFTLFDGELMIANQDYSYENRFTHTFEKAGTYLLQVRTLDENNMPGSFVFGAQIIVSDDASLFDFEYEIIDDECVITRYLDTDIALDGDSVVAIPSSISGYPVTIIGDNAFQSADFVEKVELPSTLKTISQYAFADCNSLRSIVIPNGVQTIGEHAFESCDSLKGVLLPNGLATIGMNAFSYSGIEQVRIPQSVQSMEYAFYGCGNLGIVTIEEGVCSIDRGAFAYCTSLTNVSLPDSVCRICTEAFAGCTALSQIRILETVTDIDVYAFMGIEDTITLICNPGGYVAIYAYLYGIDASFVPDPGNVPEDLEYTVIVNDGGEGYTVVITGYSGSESELLLPDYIEGMPVCKIASAAFAGNTTLTRIVLPAFMNDIGSAAFQDCINLNEVVFSREQKYPTTNHYRTTVTQKGLTLGKEAFRNTAIQMMKIPGYIDQLGNGLFYGCEKLINVYFDEGITSVSQSLFENCTNLQEVHFPRSLSSLDYGIVPQYGSYDQVMHYVYRDSYAHQQLIGTKYYYCIIDIGEADLLCDNFSVNGSTEQLTVVQGDRLAIDAMIETGGLPYEAHVLIVDTADPTQYGELTWPGMGCQYFLESITTGQVVGESGFIMDQGEYYVLLWAKNLDGDGLGGFPSDPAEIDIATYPYVVRIIVVEDKAPWLSEVTLNLEESAICFSAYDDHCVQRAELYANGAFIRNWEINHYSDKLVNLGGQLVYGNVMAPVNPEGLIILPDFGEYEIVIKVWDNHGNCTSNENSPLMVRKTGCEHPEGAHVYEGFKSQYTIKNDLTHERRESIVYRCELCGEVANTSGYWVYDEDHEWDENGVCSLCSYKKLYYDPVENPAAAPSIDMSGAKLDKSSYSPGDTIIITGIKVKNADNVHFSGSLEAVGTKDVPVSAGDSWTDIGTVTLTIPADNRQYATSYWVSVYAENKDGKKTDVENLFYDLVEAAAELPEVDMSNAKLDKSSYNPGDTITITGIKAKNAVNVHFSGSLEAVGTKDVPVNVGDSWTDIGTVILTIPADNRQYATGYWVSVYAENEDGEKTSIEKLYYDLVEEVKKVPSVQTTSATDVSTTGATLHGMLVNDYGLTVNEWGFYWSTNPLDFPIDNHYTSNDPIATGESKSYSLTGLTPNTTYYYYFYAVNSKDKSVRNVKEFTTLNDQPVAPVAVTLPEGNITANSASLNGKISSDGGSAVTEWGYAWKESGALDYHAKRFTSAITVDEVKEWTLTGLKANTEYEYYFYAVNSADEHEGSVVTFKTLPAGVTAPSMSFTMDKTTVAANTESVKFTFKTQNANAVIFYADGNEIMTVEKDLFAAAPNVYEWTYTFNTPGEQRAIWFKPVYRRIGKDDVVGSSTSAQYLDVTAYLTVSGSTSFSAYEGGGDGTPINVSSNMPWTAASDVPWITLNADMSNSILHHIYDQNRDPNARVGKITISAAGCTDVVLPVTQNAYDKAEIIGKPVLARANGSNGQNGDKFTLTVITNAATTRLSAVNNNKEPYPLNPNAFKCYPQYNGQKKWVATYIADMPHSDRCWTVIPYNEVDVAGDSMESTHIFIACSHNYREVSRSEIFRYFDEVEHILITTINKKCSWCGKTTVETLESEYRAAHMYIDGKCIAKGCGAQYVEPTVEGYCLVAESPYYYTNSGMLYIGKNEKVRIRIKTIPYGDLLSPGNVKDYTVVVESGFEDTITYRNGFVSLNLEGNDVGGRLQLVNSSGEIVSSMGIFPNRALLPEDAYPELLEEDYGFITLDAFEEKANEEWILGEKGIRISSGVEIHDVVYAFVNSISTDFPEGYYNVSFKACNICSSIYGIKTYNANGAQVGDTSFIGGYTPSIGVVNYFTKGPEYLYTETPVSIQVPNGGSIKFVQMNESDDVLAMNVVSLVLEAWSTMDSFKNVVKAIPEGSGTCTDINVLLGAIDIELRESMTKTVVKAAKKGGVQSIKALIESDEASEWFNALKDAFTSNIQNSVVQKVEDIALYAIDPLGFYVTNGGDAVYKAAFLEEHLSNMIAEMNGEDNFTLDSVLIPASDE